VDVRELKQRLGYLVDKYVDDPVAVHKLRAWISDIDERSDEMPAVKGIVAELSKHFDKRFDAGDGDLLKDIAFYFL
jgi:hypothetical protein